MTADEIRETVRSGYTEVNVSVWTKEVAAQLAELNQTLKQLAEMYRYL